MGELKDMFTTKAKELSADVAQYDADLQASVDGLNSTVTSLRSAMAQVPQVPNDPTKWDNADFDKRVVLTARLAALEQEANRFSRKRESDVSRATSQGKAVFDDVGDALSRKVGDLTSLAQKAQASFDNMPAHKSGTASIVSGKVTTLAQVEKDVAAAKLHYPASFAAIETKFAEKFKNMVDQVSDLTGTIKQELVEGTGFSEEADCCCPYEAIACCCGTREEGCYAAQVRPFGRKSLKCRKTRWRGESMPACGK